ncbi:hypothetical protein DYB36_007015 [Aphanomyces astaci]|uniref:J domain-containing protein n=1 Tax=Aphanomyces astaci TaxID=112090 RepID=A0A397AAT4_APHAT|nr:hypothetical protein DYB36_007015 [Aphanomyces astaci]
MARAVRWCSTGVTEEQVANAVVLCAAITSDDIPTFLESDSSAASLSDGLSSHSLVALDDFVLVESELSVFCCIKPTSLPQQLLDVTERQTTFRYGGRIHTALHKRATHILHLLQRPHDPQTRQSLLDIVRDKGKTLVLCGHAATGSTAHLCFLGLVYAALPRGLQLTLDAIDDAHQRDASSSSPASPPSLQAQRDLLLTELSLQDLGVRSIAFGSPCISTADVTSVLRATSLTQHMLTVVNEFDCVPNIFDIAQTVSLVSTTTRRFVEVSRALKFVLTLLPNVARVVGGGQSTMSATPSSMTQLALSYYTNQTWQLLHKAFRTFQTRLVRDSGMQALGPCGTYAFLAKDSLVVTYMDDPDAVAATLRAAMQAVSMHALRQHIVTSYVTHVSKRVAQGCSADMNHYERLHIAPDASAKDVRSAYKTHALKWHPDRWPTAAGRDKATVRFKLLAEAHEVLSDPEARAAYDKRLKQQQQEGSSWGDEFWQRGTVRGTSLDDALRVFYMAQDKLESHLSGLSSRGVVAVPKVNPPPRFQPNNHDNLFAADKMRVVRPDKSVTYVTAEDMLATDRAAGTRGGGGLAMAASAVGGAVVVGAAVAVAVHAWTTYSDSARRRRQADAIRRMPFPMLQRLLTDADGGASSVASTILPPCEPRSPHPTDIIHGHDLEMAVVPANKSTEIAALLDEFYDCVDDVGWAEVHEEAEDEYFDCLATLDPDRDEATVFPRGAYVLTPFGIGTVVADLNDEAYYYVVELVSGQLSYVQRHDVVRGAAAMVAHKERQMETVRRRVADHVVVAYSLEKDGATTTLGSMVAAGTDAAVDSGVKAAGGVALASGLERMVPGLGLAAAPLTVAAILVDVGKEYLEFRQKKSLTSASERLSMQTFWLKAGHHVASGSTAAAGATIGLYGVSTAVGYWTGAAAMGPAGLVAATGAAVVGGLLGYAAGASVYASSTREHFTSLQHASAEIDRLEVGAKVLFTQFDPLGTGYISTSDCKLLVQQLTMSQVAEGGDDEGPPCVEGGGGGVSWGVYWEWVSAKAVAKLNTLEQTRCDSTIHGHWWDRYQRYFNFASAPAALLPPSPCDPSCYMYPSVIRALAFHPPSKQVKPNKTAVNSIVELAQVDALVDSHSLSPDEAFCLQLYLQSTDESTRHQARQTIRTLTRDLDQHMEHSGDDASHVVISSAFSAEDTTGKEEDDEATEQLDVLCSLLSNRGLGRLLVDHRVDVPPDTPHDQLHGLALTHLAPRN